jgi:hypothetical protein
MNPVKVTKQPADQLVAVDQRFGALTCIRKLEKQRYDKPVIGVLLQMTS